MGNEASVAEHGAKLLAVNRAELCLQAGLDQSEWWPATHCMFGLQSCLTADGASSCAEAEAGDLDDLALAGGDADGLAACECSLAGAAAYCAGQHASGARWKSKVQDGFNV